MQEHHRSRSHVPEGTPARTRVQLRRRHLQERANNPSLRVIRASVRFSVIILVLTLGIAVFGLFILDQQYRGRILPNISIQGLRLGQQSPDEAVIRLRKQHERFLAAPVTFDFAGRVWQPTAAELGITLEVETAAARAYNIGRSARLLTSIAEAISIWRHGTDVPLSVTIDQKRLQQYLTKVARSVEVAPQNADISVINGRIATMSARIGRQVLVDETIRDVLESLSRLQPLTVTLQTRDLHPLIGNDGIAEAREQLTTLVSAPVVLTAGDQEWRWNQQELGALVRVERAPRSDGTGLRLVASLDRTLLEQRVVQVATQIDTPAVEPKLRFVNQGPEITVPGRNGRKLEIAESITLLENALWQPARQLSLPVTVVQPQVRPETLATLGIVELVAQGKSSFQDSASYRVQNIQAGARQMDGVLIPPGAEFSFNRTVGAIDESNGFTQGYAIIDGRTQLEWGGGVCQVSTTVFRAAFWAGVPITERNQHSFRIRWYEVYEPIGMDAAIFTGPGGYDFRFVNDTGSWLLMETVVDTAAEVLTVQLFGTKPAREVAQLPVEIFNEIPAPTKPRYIDDPSLPRGTVKQTDTARGGMDVRVGRIVTQYGAVVREDGFFSRFQPWPNIFVRGTGRG